MKCPLCNSDMVPVIDHDVCAIHSNKCMCCNAVVSTDEDQEKSLSSAQNALGMVVKFSKESVTRFNTLQCYRESLFKIIAVNIINGYVVVDAKLIGGEDTLRNINADMFTTWGIEKPLGSHVIFHPKVFDEPYTPYYNEYKGHQFEVIGIHTDPDFLWTEHYELRCITGDVKVKGHVHMSDIVLI